MKIPAMVKAAQEFLRDDAKRRVRPRLTELEKAELSLDLNTLSGGVPLHTSEARARRGEVAAGIIGYDDTFDEVTINVIADIMHAAAAHGYDPLRIIASARTEYYRDINHEGGQL